MKESWFAVVILLISVSLVVSQTTQSLDQFIRYNLASHTPYYPQQSQDTYLPPPRGCEALHLEVVSRHGSRDPNPTDYFKILKRAVVWREYAGNGTVRNPAFTWMKNWDPDFLAGVPGALTPVGESELFHRASRLQSYPPHAGLLKQSAANMSSYQLKTTEIPRAIRSATAFSLSLFEGKGSTGPHNYSTFYLQTIPNEKDELLRFFELCSEYKQNLIDQDAGKQSRNYAKYVIPIVADEITALLNSAPQWNVTVEDVLLMWTSCAFEFSVSGIANQFCSLFSKDSIERMNFYEDLDSYWKKGYGFPINYEMSCPLVKDMFERVENSISTESPMTSFYFAHAETVFPLVAAFGIKKDATHLHWNMTWHDMIERQWRGSVIAPFATNLVMTVYKCNSNLTHKHQRDNKPAKQGLKNKVDILEERDVQEDYLVEILLNEKQVQMCQDGIFCSWKQLKKAMTSYIHCNFSSLCAVPSPAPSKDNPTQDPISTPSFNSDGVSVKMVVVLLVVVSVVCMLIGVALTLLYVSFSSRHHYQPLNVPPKLRTSY